MVPSQILDIFSRLGIIIRNDHFIYTSEIDGVEMHGSAYVNKDGLYVYASETFKLCRELAQRSRYYLGDSINCVVGPEKGGIILSQWVGYFLEEAKGLIRKGSPVISLFAEKGKDAAGKTCFLFNRGYGDLIANKNVLIVDDVIHSGGSVTKVIKLVRQYGGNVRGVGSLCNRGNKRAEHLGVPRMFSLLDIETTSCSADICPLCANGIPINRRFGKGKEFLARLPVELPHYASREYL